MKAAVHSRGVRITEVEKPVPADDEVLVRVQTSTICAADYRLAGVARSAVGTWALKAWRRKPIVLGMELAGIVESVGKEVTRFRAGDQVFGGTGLKLGAHAEYTCVREKGLELKPTNMMLDEAAAILFGGFTALWFLRKAGIQAGQNVLVYGASGSVGVFAVQLAKHFGARVTGVCSTANLDMVRSLGADEVIDYTKQDFSASGPVYDMIYDAVGKSGTSRSVRALKRGGAFVRIAPSGGLPWSILKDTIAEVWISVSGAAKVIGGITSAVPGDLSFLKQLIEEGKLKTVIDRCYPLERIEEALRYAGTGHKRGHVLIRVATS